MMKAIHPCCHRADILFFKCDAGAQVFQLSGVVQAVLGVTGKSADGLCNDEVDFASLAVGNHAVELLTPLGAGAGNTLIRINPSQFIIRIAVDVFGVIGNLVFKAI